MRPGKYQIYFLPDMPEQWEERWRDRRQREKRNRLENGKEEEEEKHIKWNERNEKEMPR